MNHLTELIEIGQIILPSVAGSATALAVMLRDPDSAKRIPGWGWRITIFFVCIGSSYVLGSTTQSIMRSNMGVAQYVTALFAWPATTRIFDMVAKNSLPGLNDFIYLFFTGRKRGEK